MSEERALRDRAQYWVARLVAKDISESEIVELETWLASNPRHKHAFARERALWQDLSAVAEAFAQPASKPVPLSGARRFFPRRRIMQAAPVALAASFAAVFFMPSILIGLRADYQAPVGAVRSVALPDGTTVSLDSGSAISMAFDGDRRVVHLLAGRAWFDVRHESRPFLVEAAGGQTRDIGTAFEVRRESHIVEVGVTHGAVRIHAPNDTDSPILRAGDRASYDAKGFVRLSSQPAAYVAAWRKGELLFDKVPIETALAEIARYRHAPVWTFGDFGKAPPVSGLFLSARPDEALETIVRMRGLRMTTLPGGIRIIQPNRGI
ncbi:FecR family protein [Sphingobium cloacae]|uniref:FecR family protein n=1 Tax=Sphingobium cloacae TaxID=120107 RepID=UPI00082DC367|nr:FecR domain-containing protein [Sphingobium cloacae]